MNHHISHTETALQRGYNFTNSKKTAQGCKPVNLPVIQSHRAGVGQTYFGDAGRSSWTQMQTIMY